MSEESNQEVKDPAEVAAVVSRPDYIPEAIWDGEKNAPKIDLAASLAERDALKSAADERAAKIPASADAYSFDLPGDFEVPDGMKWTADAKDPRVIAVRALAAERQWTQDDVTALSKLQATLDTEELKASRAFEVEQTKALGANAEQRRAAAKVWIDGITDKDPEESKVLTTLLDYAVGVKAIERIIGKAGGVVLTGNSGGDKTVADPEQKKLNAMYPTMSAR